MQDKKNNTQSDNLNMQPAKKPSESIMDAYTQGDHAVESENVTPAGSFAASLKLGTVFVKLIILTMFVLFLFSNLFWVEEGTVAVHTRMGKIVASGQGMVLGPGGPFFALPNPIDKIIKVSTVMQTLDIDKAFWLSENLLPKGDMESSVLYPGALSVKPGLDGFLITGDQNIVQGQWAVNYQVKYNREAMDEAQPAILFARNIGDIASASKVVGHAVESAIVQVVAQTSVDNFIKGHIDNQLVLKLAQQHLTKLKSGITINSVSQKKYAVPKALVRDFQAVNRSESEKATQIEQAERRRTETLNAAAGRNYQDVLAAIERYETAVAGSQQKEIKMAEKAMADLLLAPGSEGQVSALIEKARIYRTETIEAIRGKADRFEKLLKLYHENPGILMNRLLQDTLETVFQGNVKTYYLPTEKNKEIYIDLDKR